METISSYVLTFLLNSLWQIPVFTAVALVVTLIMRNGPSSHRHAVWVVTLVASVGVPLFSSAPATDYIEPMPVIASYEATQPHATGRGALHGEQPSGTQVVRRAVPFTATATQAILVAYLLFLLFRLTRLLRAWINTWRVQESALSAQLSPEVVNVWDRCRRSLGVDADLRVSKHLSSPAAAGALRPSVILPVSMMAGASDDVLTTAIGHELAHVARRDYGWNLLYEFLLIPVAFHPAANWIGRAIRQTRELACDELVTRGLIKADVYARSILEIASNSLTPRQADYSLGVFDADILEHRIHRLMKHRVTTGRKAFALLGAALACLFLCGIFLSGSAILARAQSGTYSDLKLGEAAYNKQDFAAAIRHFQSAAARDTTNVRTKLFLANALIARWFIEKAAPFSPHVAAAQQQYEQVLAYEPNNKEAMHGLAGIALNSHRPKEALEIVNKLIRADRSDATAHHTAGVANWAIAYEDYAIARDTGGYPAHEYFLPDPVLRKSLRMRHSQRIEEGLRNLERALNLRPDFDEAMAYTNLLLRLRSGIVETEAESRELLEEADTWVGKALGLMRARKLNPPSSVPLNVDGPPPSLAETRKLLPLVPAPLPPPPPPLGYRGAAR